MFLFVDIHRQFFVVHNNGDPLPTVFREMLVEFTTRFKVTNITKDFRRPWDKSLWKEQVWWYCTHTPSLREFRYNINALNEFVYFLKERGVKPEQLNIKRVPPPEPLPLKVKTRDGMKPRDYQIPQIDYIVNNDYPTWLLDMQTGKGKTFTSLAAITKLDMRTFVFVLPKYIEKWKQDLKKNTNVRDRRVFTIQGGKSLRDFMAVLIKGSKKPAFILASNRTMLNYLKEYEASVGTDEPFTYPLTPDEFFQKLRAGIMLIDEVHQHFAGCMKMSMYADVKHILACSATLENNDTRITRMYYYMFPAEHRPPKMKIDKYIEVYPVGYTTPEWCRLAVKGFNGAYSHINYEKSIMRNKKLLQGYLNMVLEYTRLGYIERRKKGEKCLVFASSIAMCNKILAHLRKHHRNLDIRRYVEDDPMENILEPDICVTTLLSGGTAIDIPNLITVVQTIAVDSIQANKQSLGRLRKIPGRDVRFYYFYNKRVGVHLKYHKNRLKKWKEFVARFIHLTYTKMGF